MLVIRAAQMEALRQQAPRNFEAEMAAHLADLAPDHARALGDAQIRALVRLGIERAARHGFDRRGPVRLYLDAMLLLGSHFDTDPQYPWAPEVLSARAPVSPMDRAQRLFDQLQDYSERALGPAGAWRDNAHRAMAALAWTPWHGLAQDLPDHVLSALWNAWPEKADVVGATGLRTLVHTSIATAHARGIRTARGWGLFAILAFGLGHGCDRDPLYPWIATSLATDRPDDGQAAEDRLQTAALDWLERVAP